MASEAEIPESIVKQTHHDTDLSMQESIKETQLAEVKGHNENTNGEYFLYPPSVEKVAPKDMGELSENSQESALSEKEKITVHDSDNNQQMDSKYSTRSEKMEQISEQVSPHTEDNEHAMNKGAEVDVTVSKHDTMLDNRAVHIPIHDPSQTLEVVETDMESDNDAVIEKICTDTTVPIAPMPVRELEGTPPNTEKLNGGDKETLPTEVSVASQIATSLAEDDKDSISETVRECMEEGIQPPQSTIIEEKISVQQDEKGFESEKGSNQSLEKYNHEKSEISQKSNEKLRVECKDIETDKENQEDKNPDEANNNGTESLSPTLHTELTNEENLKAGAEKESLELIESEECMERKESKHQETGSIYRKETVKMVPEDTATWEATDETVFPEEGETNLSTAASENHEKVHNTLDADSVLQNNTTEIDVKEMTGDGNCNISNNENYASLGHNGIQPLENAYENQYASLEFKPKEQVNQEAEEKTHNVYASEADETIEPAVSESDYTEAKRVNDLNSATSTLKEVLLLEEKDQDKNVESKNFCIEKGGNESTFFDDQTNEITKYITPDSVVQETDENLQEKKIDDRRLHPSITQEVEENAYIQGAMSESTALEMAECQYSKMEEGKSTEETSDHKTSVPQKEAPPETRIVNEILDEVLDLSVEKGEASIKADNHVLFPKENPTGEKLQEITSVQEDEEIDVTIVAISPAECNQSEPTITDRDLEQEPFTRATEAHALRNQAGHNQNSKESSEQMAALIVERAVDLPCQQDNGELIHLNKESSNIGEITNDEYNVTPNASKEENVDNLGEEESITNNITEESTHCHHTDEESTVKVETEETESEKRTKKTSCEALTVLAEKKGDDMVHSIPPTEADEDETATVKKVYHVDRSLKSDLNKDSGREKTMDKTEVIQTDYNHTASTVLHKELSEKGLDSKEKITESNPEAEDIQSREGTSNTTSTTMAVETSLESPQRVDLKDKSSSNLPSSQIDSSICCNVEYAIISGDIERVYDLDQISDKDMVTAVESTTEESMDKHTQDEVSNMRQEVDGEAADVQKGTLSDSITEDFRQLSSLLPKTEATNIDENFSGDIEKEGTSQEIRLERSTMDLDIEGNVSESSNIKGQVCLPIMAESSGTEDDNRIINERSREHIPDHEDQNQPTSIIIEQTAPDIDAEDTFRQDDCTDISNDRLQISKKKEEASEGDHYDQEIVSTVEDTEPVDALEKFELCSGSANASINSTVFGDANNLDIEEERLAIKDQESKSDVNSVLEEHDKIQDLSITGSKIEVEGEGSKITEVDEERATKEFKLDEVSQSSKMEANEEGIPHVMAEKDKIEKVIEDSHQQHNESVSKDGKEYERIWSSDIHSTNPIKDKEIDNHFSEENSANGQGIQKTFTASAHKDECTGICNDRMQAVEIQEEERIQEQLENAEDEGPSSIVDGVSARENPESRVGTDNTEHRTNSEVDNNQVSIEAMECTASKNKLITYLDAESLEHLGQEGHNKEEGLSLTGVETELKDKESVNNFRNVNKATNAFEIDEETQGFTKELNEEIIQSVITTEKAGDKEHSESNTEESDNIKSQEFEDKIEQSGYNQFQGTHIAKGEKIVNQPLNKSNCGNNMQINENLQASMTNIDVRMPVSVKDKCATIPDGEIHFIEDDKEATNSKQEDSPDNKTENTMTHGVSGEEIVGSTEEVEKLECGLEYIKLIEDNQNENETTTIDANDTDSKYAENLIINGYGDNKTLSTKVAKTKLVECSPEEVEDATQHIDKLEVNKESQGSERYIRDEDFQQAIKEGRTDYEVKSPGVDTDSPQLQNERNACISDNIQVQEVENITELCKSHEMNGSYAVRDRKIVDQSLVTDNTSDTTGVEVSGKTVDLELDNLIIDEFYDTNNDKTQHVLVTEEVETNAEDHTHELDKPDTINSIYVEESPGQVLTAKYLESGTETRGEETEFQVKFVDTSSLADKIVTMNVKGNDDVAENSHSSRTAQLDGNPLCEVSKLDTKNQGIKEVEKQEVVNIETTNKTETVNAEGNDGSSNGPGALISTTYEDRETSGEFLSSEDVLTQTFDTPDKGILENEKQGVEYGETTKNTETANAENKHDLPEETGILDAEIVKESNSYDVLAPDVHVSTEGGEETEIPVIDFCKAAIKTNTLTDGVDNLLEETTEENTPLKVSQSCKDVTSPEFDFTHDSIEEEKQGVQCDKTTNKIEIVTAGIKNDISHEHGTLNTVKILEACSELETTQSSEHVPLQFHILKQEFTEEKQAEGSRERAYKREIADADIKKNLQKDLDASTVAYMSEKHASLDEILSCEDDLDFKLDNPKEGINDEKHEDNCGKTACETETVNVDVNEKLFEEPSKSITAQKSERHVPEVWAPVQECFLKDETDERETHREICGEITCKSEFTKEECDDNLPEEPCVIVSDKTDKCAPLESWNAEVKDNLLDSGTSESLKMSEECLPMEKGRLSKDLSASKFENPDEGIRQEEMIEVWGETCNETLNAEVKVDLPEEAGTSIVVKMPVADVPMQECQPFEDVVASQFKILNDDRPEKPHSLSTANILEGVPSGEGQSSEDVLVSRVDIPKERIIEKEDDTGETACNMKTECTQANDDVLQEPHASNDSDAENTNSCTLSVETKSSKEVQGSQIDIPKEDTKVGEKQGKLCCETANKMNILNPGIEGDLTEELGTTVEATTGESCFYEDAPNIYTPERDTNEDEQGVKSGVTEHNTEMMKDEVKECLDEELGASIAGKTPEEHSTCEKRQLAEELLDPEFDIQKECTEKEKQGMDLSKHTLNITIETEETNSQESHMEANTIKAQDFSETEEDKKENGRKEFPSQVEQTKSPAETKTEVTTSPEDNQGGDVLLREISANQYVEEVELNDFQGVCTMKANESVQHQSLQDQLWQSRSQQHEPKQKAISAKQGIEVRTMNSQAPSMDWQLSKELIKSAEITESLKFKAANSSTDSETKNKTESHADSFSQNIISNSELQLSNKADHNDMSPQPDATSVFQEQIVSSEQMHELYGQKFITSEDTEGEKQLKEGISELIYKENQSEMNFEKHEARTGDTTREKNIERAEPLEKLSGSSEVLVSTEKSSELSTPNLKVIEENSTEDKGQNAQYTERCSRNDYRDESPFVVEGNKTNLDERFLKKAKETNQIAEELKINPESNGSEATKEDIEQATREITDNKINILNPKEDAYELNKAEVQDEKTCEATSNEVDNSNQGKDQVVTVSDNGSSNMEKPYQQACEGVEASELSLSGLEDLQNLDESNKISNDTGELVHIQEEEAKEAEREINCVCIQEVKGVNEPSRAKTVDKEEKDAIIEEMHGSNVIKKPEKQAQHQKIESSEDVMAQEIDNLTEKFKKPQLVTCHDNKPKNENMISVKGDMSLQEPYQQENLENALNTNSTTENVKDIIASDNTARVTLPLYELTAAEIIASQISLVIEREEKIQQLSSVKVRNKHETTTIRKDNSTWGNQVLLENTNNTSIEEMINNGCLSEDGHTELEFPNSECEINQTNLEKHKKTISSEPIVEEKSTITSEAPEATICAAAKDVSQCSLHDDTKARNQHENTVDTEKIPEKDEGEPALARVGIIPDEKISSQDPKVAQEGSLIIESPDISEKVVREDEQDRSTKINFPSVAGQTDEAAIESQIVPHIPEVQPPLSEEKVVRVEDNIDKDLHETQQMAELRKNDNANTQSMLVVKKEEIHENDGSSQERRQREAESFNETSEEQKYKGISTTESDTGKVAYILPLDPTIRNSQIARTANSGIGKMCQEEKCENINIKTQPMPAESTRISPSDTIQRSSAQTCQTEKGEQIVFKGKMMDREDATAEERSTDDEMGNDENQTDLDIKAPFITETMRDIDIKTHKKSHNILSGVGSKVKHSISKVKKAITCSSSQFASEDVIVKLNKNKSKKSCG